MPGVAVRKGDHLHGYMTTTGSTLSLLVPNAVICMLSPSIRTALLKSKGAAWVSEGEYWGSVLCLQTWSKLTMLPFVLLALTWPGDKIILYFSPRETAWVRKAGTGRYRCTTKKKAFSFGTGGSRGDPATPLLQRGDARVKMGHYFLQHFIGDPVPVTAPGLVEGGEDLRASRLFQIPFFFILSSLEIIES